MNGSPYVFHIRPSGAIRLFPHDVPYSVFRPLGKECRTDRTFVLHRSGRLFYHTFILRLKDEKGRNHLLGMSMCHNSWYNPDIHSLYHHFEKYYRENAYLLVKWIQGAHTRKRKRIIAEELETFLAGMRGKWHREWEKKKRMQAGLLPDYPRCPEQYLSSRITADGVIKVMGRGGDICIFIDDESDTLPELEFLPGHIFDEWKDTFLRRIYADLGDPYAQLNCGQWLLLSRRKKDRKAGYRWVTLAASQGLEESYFTLGDCYRKGEGCEPDLEEATRMYLKSLRKKKVACYFIALTYYRRYPGLKGAFLRNLWEIAGSMAGDKRSLQSLRDRWTWRRRRN